MMEFRIRKVLWSMAQIRDGVHIWIQLQIQILTHIFLFICISNQLALSPAVQQNP